MTLLLVNHHYTIPRIGQGAIYPCSVSDMVEKARYLVSIGYKYIDNFQDYFDKDLYDHNCKYFHYTFDDGLAEQYYAFEELSSYGYAPTYFISTKKYITKEPDIVHMIHYARHKYGPQKLDKILLQSYDISNYLVKRAREQYRYDSVDAATSKYLLNFALTQDQVRKIVMSILNPIDADYFQELYMDIKQLRNLCTESRVGSHASTHIALGTISAKNLITELSESKQFFNDQGFDVNSISYPYGGPTAIPDTKIVSEYYDYGISMQRSLNNQNTDRIRLNRIDTNDVKLIKNVNDSRLFHLDLRTI
jgi:hypothetical protein